MIQACIPVKRFIQIIKHIFKEGNYSEINKSKIHKNACYGFAIVFIVRMFSEISQGYFDSKADGGGKDIVDNIA